MLVHVLETVHNGVTMNVSEKGSNLFPGILTALRLPRIAFDVFRRHFQTHDLPISCLVCSSKQISCDLILII